MKKLLCLFLLVSAAAMAQTAITVRPDCFQFYSFTAPANSLVFDNRSAGCPYFAVTYSSSGFSALSLVMQVAPDNNGTPGAWATYTAGAGSNPNTATDQAFSTFSGYFPWVRIQLTSVTGTGTITGIFYGWRTTASVINGGGGGGGGCVGTAGTPCRVAGPNANNTAPSAPPVFIAGWDNGGRVRGIITGSAGQMITIPDWQTSVLGNYSANFGCDQSAFFTTASSGSQQIVALAMGADIYVCHYEWSTSGGPETVSLEYGTGSNCGTGKTVMTRQLNAVNSSQDYLAPNSLRNFANLTPGAGNALCVNPSAAQTIAVTVTYAQF
jgi:hypothetical protein